MANGVSGTRGGAENSISALGLKLENSVDESRFDFQDKRYGKYAAELAHKVNHMVLPGEQILSYTKGNNIAYAYIDAETDTLFDIFSTGGGTGTDLLVKLMQYQQGKGRGLNWIAERKSSQKYYDDYLGLKKYGEGEMDRYYNIPASEMAEVIKKIKK